MCLSRSGVRVINALRRALRMNGAIALTSCTSSISTVEISANSRRQELRPRRSTCCRSLSSSRWETVVLRYQLVDEKRHLRQLRGVHQARLAAGTRQLAFARARASLSALRFSLHHVRIERGRPAHGLTCVVDDEVQTALAWRSARGRTPRRLGYAEDRARTLRGDLPSRRNQASREYRDAESRGKRVVTIRCAPDRSSLRPA